MLRCIRFGEVLLDETFRTFLICNQCQMEFVEIPEFRVHLATSVCGQRLFKDDVVALKFGAAQVTRASKDKTYLLYNPADVQIATTEAVINSAPTTTTDGGEDAYLDLMKIEEELLDPRWYTDIGNTEVDSPQHSATLHTAGNNNKTLEYKELVEAVGPYVQFKDGVTNTKGKQNIVIKRVPNKVNKPAMSAPPVPPATTTTVAVPKNSVLPAKRDASTDKPAIRLLNPAAKRKLDLTPKQVHFKDEVSIKYLLNETCNNAVANKRTRSLGNENNAKARVGEGAAAILKRRKTITIPMDHVNIHPDFQEQFGGGCLATPKATTVEKFGTNATAATKKAPVEASTNKTAKPNSLINTGGNTNTKQISAPAKATPNTTIMPKNALVTNPIVIQKHINGTKTQMKNNAMLVKNPGTCSRASSSNSLKIEKSLQISKPTTTVATTALGPNIANKTNAPTVARPQQRANSTSSTQPLVQASSYAVTNKKIPPALAPLSSNKISNSAAFAAPKVPPKDAQQQTNDILNKLQTRGLQVKRTQPLMPPPSATVQQQKKTMELLQKLQSKGMKVKILNGREIAHVAAAPVAPTNFSINMPFTGVNTKIMSNVGSVRNVSTAINTQNKTILNNKIIIKKVK